MALSFESIKSFGNELYASGKDLVSLTTFKDLKELTKGPLVDVVAKTAAAAIAAHIVGQCLVSHFMITATVSVVALAYFTRANHGLPNESQFFNLLIHLGQAGNKWINSSKAL